RTWRSATALVWRTSPGAAHQLWRSAPASVPLVITRRHRGGVRPGQASAPDAIADMGRVRRVDHPDDLQLDARRQYLEQPAPGTEQHPALVDLQLVKHANLERALRR